MKDEDTLGKGPGQPIPEELATNEAMAAFLATKHVAYFEHDPKASLRPMMMVLCGNGDVCIVGVAIDINDEGEKDQFARHMRQQFKEWGVVRYAYCSEAWMAMVSAETNPELRRVQPKDRPDRREIIMTLVVDHDSAVMVNQDILRDTKGDVVGLKMDEVPGAVPSGRFATLLKDGEWRSPFPGADGMVRRPAKH